MKISDDANDRSGLPELIESLPDRLFRRRITQLADRCFIKDHRPRAVRAERPGETPARNDLHVHLIQIVVIYKIKGRIERLHLAPSVLDLTLDENHTIQAHCWSSCWKPR